MKKLLVGSATGLMMAAGALTAVGSTAYAADYEDDVATKCRAFAVGNPVSSKAPKIRVDCDVKGGSADDLEPKGRVVVECEKFNGKDEAESPSVFTRGDAFTVALEDNVKPGRYACTATFTAKPGSRFQDSVTSFTITVARKK